MPRKGNGQDLTNGYLRQILEKLGEVLLSQEAMRGELQHHGQRLENIEQGVRQIATFVGEDRIRQDRDVAELKRRVEVLERKAA